MPTLRILGVMSGAPEPGAACPSYLVQHNNTQLLLDIGPGSLAELRRQSSVHALDAIFITHLHTDHFLDILPFNTARWTEPPTGEMTRLPVYLPPGGIETVEAAFHALTVNVTGSTAARYREALDLREYEAGQTICHGDLQFTVVGPMEHATTAYGVRVQAGSAVIGYTGDTAPCEAALAIGRSADLFLAECTYAEAGLHPAAKHTSADELAMMANEARPRLLVATHFAGARWPKDHAERRQAVTARIRAAGYAGPLAVASPGDAFVL